MGVPAVWRINRFVNGVALLAALVLLVFLAVTFVLSFVRSDADPHGYGRIFSVVLGIVVLLPTSLLAAGASSLRRSRRSGFVFEALAGVIVVGYSLLLDPFSIVGATGLTLGTVLGVAAISGIVVTR